jgi:16S rRNA U1498 N3-methylase RsmE
MRSSVQSLSSRCSSLLLGTTRRNHDRMQLLRNYPHTHHHQHAVVGGATRTYSSRSLNEEPSKNSNQDVTKLARLYVGPLDETPRLVKSTDSLAAALSEPPPKMASRSPLVTNSIVPLSMDQSHYVRSVLRLGGGSGKKRKTAGPARLRLFDGVSTAADDVKKEWLAEVVLADDNNNDDDVSNGNRRRRQQKQQSEPVLVQCLEALQSSASSSSTAACWLSIAAPKKRERLKWMLEKTTELGVAGWILLETDRSEVTVGSGPDDNNSLAAFTKWQAYAVEAAEQCERTELPQFVTIVDDNNDSFKVKNDKFESPLRTKLSNLFDMWSKEQLTQSKGNATTSSRIKILVCRERINSLPVWRALETIYNTASSTDEVSVMFLIGPEGGWSPAEEECMNEMESKHPGCLYNVSLGPTVLRAETAAMTAAAAYTLYHDSR